MIVLTVNNTLYDNYHNNLFQKYHHYLIYFYTENYLLYTLGHVRYRKSSSKKQKNNYTGCTYSLPS